MMELKVRNGWIDLESDETRKKTQGAFTYHGFEAIHYKLLFEMFSYLLTQECFPMGKSVSHAVSRLLNWS